MTQLRTWFISANEDDVFTVALRFVTEHIDKGRPTNTFITKNIIFLYTLKIKMKITDYLNEKYGQDKLTHFFAGAWLNALLTPFGAIPTIVGFFVIYLIGFIKELNDAEFDKQDLLFATIGSGITVIIYLFMSIFL